VLRPASALLPASHGVRADVQVKSKHRLACVERPANPADLRGGDPLGRRRQFGHAKIRSLAQAVIAHFLQSLFQFVENPHTLLCHVVSPYFLLSAARSRSSFRSSGLRSSRSSLSNK